MGGGCAYSPLSPGWCLSASTREAAPAPRWLDQDGVTHILDKDALARYLDLLISEFLQLVQQVTVTDEGEPLVPLDVGAFERLAARVEGNEHQPPLIEAEPLEVVRNATPNDNFASVGLTKNGLGSEEHNNDAWEKPHRDLRCALAT